MLDKLPLGYDVHVFCGHSHFFQDVDVNEHLYQHNIGAACGAWWWGVMLTDVARQMDT